jgi:hypothetical protein
MIEYGETKIAPPQILLLIPVQGRLQLLLRIRGATLLLSHYFPLLPRRLSVASWVYTVCQLSAVCQSLVTKISIAAAG